MKKSEGGWHYKNNSWMNKQTFPQHIPLHLELKVQHVGFFQHFHDTCDCLAGTSFVWSGLKKIPDNHKEHEQQTPYDFKYNPA